eukprot:TRINITY_DN24474_c0_g2_i1.p1 TRINITY_DN24474_c0_g2~~TRINITY_DN24474_c0_g2_i1.p1  ORF type:complete len:1946 (-),score=303.44 TRINITY_DN24474_c0_g2_i1:87-5924(-)
MSGSPTRHRVSVSTPRSFILMLRSCTNAAFLLVALIHAGGADKELEVFKEEAPGCVEQSQCQEVQVPAQQVFHLLQLGEPDVTPELLELESNEGAQRSKVILMKGGSGGTSAWTSSLWIAIVLASVLACCCCSLACSSRHSLGSDGASQLGQVFALSKKNAKVQARAQLPKPLNCPCGILSLQMFCQLFAISMAVILPAMIASGDDVKTIHHPVDYGLDAHPDQFERMDDPGMVMFFGDSSQQDYPPCFCRTIAVTGPSAEEFASFGRSEYSKLAAVFQNKVADYFQSQCPAPNKSTFFRVFKDKDEIDDWINDKKYNEFNMQRGVSGRDGLCGAVILQNNITDAVPKYLIRTNITAFGQWTSKGTQVSHGTPKDTRVLHRESTDFYLKSGFLGLQKLVQNFVVQKRLGHTIPALENQGIVPLPVPAYTSNVIREGTASSLPMQANSLLMWTAMLVTYMFVRERRTKQKELMRLIGLTDTSLLGAWLLMFGAINVVISLVCTVITKIWVVTQSDVFVLFLLYFLAMMSTTSVALATGSCFSKENLGTMASACVMQAMGIATSLVYDQDDSMIKDGIPNSYVFVVSLLPPVALQLGLHTYLRMDVFFKGCTLSTIMHVCDGYQVAACLAIMSLSIFAWLFLHMYLEQVIDHGVGMTRPWHFPLLASYWKEVFGCSSALGESQSDDHDAEDPGEAADLFEAESAEHLKALRDTNKVVSIRGLRKDFVKDSGVVLKAVDNLNLTMYEGECFCLLGHNGAGKSTTMSLMTGISTPTAGFISVYGMLMPTDASKIRSNMGFCMQHDVIWDELTVEEHIWLFHGLLGIPHEKGCVASTHLLTEVELINKRHSYARSLSGGMKRKLNVALALLGDRRIVMLDEPTAGMDPHARRQLWGILKTKRAGRILCLTTHYMDEADELGDRICIMASGKAAVRGTSSFLKRRLGCGYIMTFVKHEDNVADEPIVRLLRKHCGDAVMVASSVGRELVTHVPFSCVSKFPDMMEGLDNQMHQLSIESYGVGVANLEEVFVKVAEGRLTDSKPGSGAVPMAAAAAPAASMARQHSTGTSASSSTSKGSPSLLVQLYGLFKRRTYYGRRDSRMCCCQLLTPLVLVILGFAVMDMFETTQKDVLLDISDFNANNERDGRAFVTIGVENGNSELAKEAEDAWNQDDTVDARFNASIVAEPNESIGKSFARYAYEQSLQTKSLQYGAVLYMQNETLLYTNTTQNQAAPALLNMMFSDMLRWASLKAKADPFDHMEISIHPFQLTHSENDVVEGVSALSGTMMVLFGLSFATGGLAAFIVTERELSVTNQLIVSGCSRSMYWLSNFIFDYLCGCITMVGIFLAMNAYDYDQWTSGDRGQAVMVLLALYPAAAAGQAYLLSFLFSSGGAAMAGVLLVNAIFGLLGLTIPFVMESQHSTKNTGKALRWIARILLPSVCVGDGLFELAADDFEKNMSLGHEKRKSAFSRKLTGEDIALLAAEIVFYAVATLLVDSIQNSPGLQRLFDRSKPAPQYIKYAEDEPVIREQKDVKNLKPESQVLLIDDVYKTFDGAQGPVYAVRGVSFAVPAGQVFGLLGVNGAGKTTTFKMLCGELVPTSGKMFIQGKNSEDDFAEIRKLIGYCPQFNALWDLLTVTEHLEIYSRIRGYEGDQLQAVVKEKLTTFDLQKYEDARAGSLSGGNMRKLMCSIATIGDPPIIFLDEPSAGMDVVARRHMWDVIHDIAEQRKKSAVILTTHSMEEANALCSRMCIQVAGQLRCLGTPQQLKDRYGEGLELNLQLAVPDSTDIEAICSSWGLSSSQTCQENSAKDLCKQAGNGLEVRLNDRDAPYFGATKSVATSVFAEWYLLSARREAVEDFMVKNIGKDGAKLVEKSAGSLRYKLVGTSVGGGPKPLGELFAMFEAQRATLRLADFQISQATLEQTFNRFAAEDIQRQAKQEAEDDTHHDEDSD